ncbi:winged helix-turn-helix transcriptional regulator [Alteraurantiacibacter buctensis]|uniref:Transcriptional regulator n=1 Tax=Alteraurantiacibacter buctensis TaxID=1503981 RepID=A0A844Z119_9SPHN|nr:helix-turn-helix domain-containing protein [Alteraurantiacibacter buctensis]MXO72671.1 transcriptional regulator [Alteraurantiacibacter buctensis]
MELQKEILHGRLHGRWYDDACGTAFALEVVGERWALLVLRELMFGPLRFSDLKAALPGISAKVLTERLAGLEQAGVVARAVLPPPARGTQVYELTPWGLMAEPMIQEMGRWAARSPIHDPRLPLSPVSLMLSLRTMLDRKAAKGKSADVGFAVAGQEFRARLEDRKLPITREPVAGAQIVVRAPDAALVAATIYAGVPASDLPGLVIEGDTKQWQRFAALFSLPPKVG